MHRRGAKDDIFFLMRKRTNFKFKKGRNNPFKKKKWRKDGLVSIKKQCLKSVPKLYYMMKKSHHPVEVKNHFTKFCT